MAVHVVRPGDCLASLASRYGFASAGFLYDLPENAELRARRPDPHVLLPGDSVFVPERETSAVGVATGREHRFRVEQPRVKLRVHVREPDGKALGSKRYALVFGETTREGTTGGDGLVEEEIPADLTAAELRVYLGGHGVGEDDYLPFALAIGHLDPVEETSGALHRLHNLGYSIGSRDALDDTGREAVRAFQRVAGLDETGELDDATRAKLRDDHEGT